MFVMGALAYKSFSKFRFGTGVENAFFDVHCSAPQLPPKAIRRVATGEEALTRYQGSPRSGELMRELMREERPICDGANVDVGVAGDEDGVESRTPWRIAAPLCTFDLPAGPTPRLFGRHTSAPRGITCRWSS